MIFLLATSREARFDRTNVTPYYHCISRSVKDEKAVAKYRERLGELGWFMEALKEPLAQMANKKDDCKSTFWKGRFKSTAILDEEALLATCAYIDLNPFAAGLSAAAETAKHTSVRQRVPTCSCGHADLNKQGPKSGSIGLIAEPSFRTIDCTDPTGSRKFSMKRISIALGVIVLILGSLLTFPAHLHWMVSIWLLLSLIASVNQKSMWPWLVGCVLILVIKRPGFTPEFWGLTALFILVATIDEAMVRNKLEPVSKMHLTTFALVLVAATAMYGATRWFGSNSSRRYKVDERPIACLGDSLTDYGYPQELEKRISLPVADFGVSGIKTDDGIEMIPRILATNPQLVVIELGGHDYNADKKPRSATKSNLEILIETFLDQNIAVILVEIPRGFITDPYHGLERELATKYDLQLIDDSVIRSFVFSSPIIPPGMWLDPSRRYSDDGLHPNALGNEYFARVVSQSLVKVFGESILR